MYFFIAAGLRSDYSSTIGSSKFYLWFLPCPSSSHPCPCLQIYILSGCSFPVQWYLLVFFQLQVTDGYSNQVKHERNLIDSYNWDIHGVCWLQARLGPGSKIKYHQDSAFLLSSLEASSNVSSTMSLPAFLYFIPSTKTLIQTLLTLISSAITFERASPPPVTPFSSTNESSCLLKHLNSLA